MKLKTSKSAAKRIIKITRRGKVLRRKMSAQHLRQGKSKRSQKQAGRFVLVAKSDVKRIKRLLPYK